MQHEHYEVESESGNCYENLLHFKEQYVTVTAIEPSSDIKTNGNM
jgi:hypothetical protein